MSLRNNLHYGQANVESKSKTDRCFRSLFSNLALPNLLSLLLCFYNLEVKTDEKTGEKCYKAFLLPCFVNSFRLDNDECASSEANQCHLNSLCTNTEGSYVCRCLRGYVGDGLSCAGICFNKL